VTLNIIDQVTAEGANADYITVDAQTILSQFAAGALDMALNPPLQDPGRLESNPQYRVVLLGLRRPFTWPWISTYQGFKPDMNNGLFERAVLPASSTTGCRPLSILSCRCSS
jgi:hypothetical protein